MTWRAISVRPYLVDGRQSDLTHRMHRPAHDHGRGERGGSGGRRHAARQWHGGSLQMWDIECHRIYRSCDEYWQAT
jgi:hypothetical protein